MATGAQCDYGRGLSSVSLPASSKTRMQTGPLTSPTTNFDFFVLLDEELGFPENKPEMEWNSETDSVFCSSICQGFFLEVV